MKLEDICCSLEYAKRLKEMGVKQDSLFYWNEEFIDEEKVAVLSSTDKGSFLELQSYSAFTVAELGELLTAGIIQTIRDEKPKYGKYIQIDKCPKWDDQVKKWCIYLAGDLNYTSDDNEADARAKMLIWMLEEGIQRSENEKP